MSEGKMIEIYNQGLTQVMSVMKELTNEIKSLNSQVETLSKDNKALSDRVKSLESEIKKIAIIVANRHHQMVLKRKLRV